MVDWVGPILSGLRVPGVELLCVCGAARKFVATTADGPRDGHRRGLCGCCEEVA